MVVKLFQSQPISLSRTAVGGFSFLFDISAFDVLAIQDQNGHTFLKIQASSTVMSKLICKGQLKNSSLANSSKINELKQKRNDKLQSKLSPENQSAKKLKGEQIVEIEVGSVAVTILCPAKRASLSDLLVRLEESQLSAVFSYLKADCKQDDKAKRSYTKSGKFAKGSSKPTP